MARKILLICGILSSLLYVGTDILAAMCYKGYSYTAQTISELSAIGAPTRPLVVPLYLAYDVLLIAFGLGIWTSDRRTRAVRFTARLLGGIGVIGLVAPFPMHMRGAGLTLTDTMHIIVMGGIALVILLTIGVGANAFGKRFRLYSIVTIVVLVMGGTFTGLNAAQVAANLPTPWIGVAERINVYGFMLWIAVLAVALLRARDSAATDHVGRRSDSGLVAKPAA